MDIKIYNFDDLTPTMVYKIIQHRQEVFILGDRTIFNDCDDKDFNAIHVVGYEGDDIVAYLRILKHSKDDTALSFGRVSVNTKKRGLNYGKEIVDFTTDYILNTLKCDNIKISSQSHVTGFYEKLGYKITSKVYDIQGVDHNDMEYIKL